MPWTLARVWAGALFLLIAAGASYLASRYELGTLRQMGPGMFPLIVSVLLALLGIAVLMEARRAGEIVTLNALEIRQVAAIVGSVVIFGVLLEPTGLFITVAASVIASQFGLRQFNWRRAILAVLVLEAIAYFFFILILKIRMPLFPDMT